MNSGRGRSEKRLAYGRPVVRLPLDVPGAVVPDVHVGAPTPNAQLDAFIVRKSFFVSDIEPGALQQCLRLPKRELGVWREGLPSSSPRSTRSLRRVRSCCVDSVLVMTCPLLAPGAKACRARKCPTCRALHPACLDPSHGRHHGRSRTCRADADSGTLLPLSARDATASALGKAGPAETGSTGMQPGPEPPVRQMPLSVCWFRAGG